MQQIYRRTPMSKCDFNKVASNFIEITRWHRCSPVNMLYIFRTSFHKNTFRGLLLLFVTKAKYFSKVIFSKFDNQYLPTSCQCSHLLQCFPLLYSSAFFCIRFLICQGSKKRESKKIIFSVHYVTQNFISSEILVYDQFSLYYIYVQFRKTALSKLLLH